MLIKKVISPPPSTEWREVFRSDASATPFQSPEWMTAIEQTGRYSNASRLYQTAGGRIIVPLALRASVLGHRSASSMPHGFGAGGCISDYPIGKEDILTLLEDLEDLKVRKLSIRPNPVQIDLWPEEQIGWSASSRVSHVIDLTGGYEKVWQERFRGTKRNRIRKARKAGMRIDKGNDTDLLEKYFSIYLRWSEARARRRKLPPQLIRFLAVRREPKWKFENVAKTMGSRLQIYIASIDETPVAGTVFLNMGKSAVYWRGASDPDLLSRFPGNDLLQNEMIFDACQAGCSAYHMGESGGVDSLMRFKSDFGAVAIPYAEFHRNSQH
ncbi:GNAT family N-acetyltransferase [Roseibium sp. SCP14]|uniref:GNAT family N-acetyltransferase n=1 Tax=Roseibium sp. SCP14 TaxID=3141375 RepID=UPI00333A4470